MLRSTDYRKLMDGRLRRQVAMLIGSASMSIYRLTPRRLSNSRWSSITDPAIYVRAFSFLQARRLASEHFGAGGKRTSGADRSLGPWGEHDLVDVELVVDPDYPDMGVAGVIRIEPLKC